MSSDAERLPLIYKGVKYIRIKAIRCTDENNNLCAFRNSECMQIVYDCTGVIFHPDPDPINLINYKLLK